MRSQCKQKTTDVQYDFIEGHLGVKLPTKWTDEAGRRRERVRTEKDSSRKIKVREKIEQSRDTVFFQCFVPRARCEIKDCTLLWREANLQVKMVKTHHCQSTLGS